MGKGFYCDVCKRFSKGRKLDHCPLCKAVSKQISGDAVGCAICIVVYLLLASLLVGAGILALAFRNSNQVAIMLDYDNIPSSRVFVAGSPISTLRLRSENGRCIAYLQHDGNLVIYNGLGGYSAWASRTDGELYCHLNVLPDDHIHLICEHGISAFHFPVPGNVLHLGNDCAFHVMTTKATTKKNELSSCTFWTKDAPSAKEFHIAINTTATGDLEAVYDGQHIKMKRDGKIIWSSRAASPSIEFRYTNELWFGSTHGYEMGSEPYAAICLEAPQSLILYGTGSRKIATFGPSH